MVSMRSLLLPLACTIGFGAGCAKLPAECSDEALAKASDVEALSEKTFALHGVRDTLAKVTEAREAIAKETPRWAILRDYDDAKVLCEQATIEANETRTDIEMAKKRKAEVDALTAKSNGSLDDAGIALLTGRALLDAVPQPALDEKLRAIQAQHLAVNEETNVALAQMKGSGFTDDTEIITKHTAAMEAALRDASKVALDIRRGATEACKPTAMVDGSKTPAPLFIGPGRARSHDGFAVVEAGLSEEQASGYVAVVARVEGGCRTLYTAKAGAPGALPTGMMTTLRSWRIGGAIPVKIMFAWLAPQAWFIADSGGSWSFDAAKVAGFEGKCRDVSCTDPQIRGDQIDVSCTCNVPVKADELDLSRSVKFSWQGNAVIAER
jgi:hypothetical protein